MGLGKSTLAGLSSNDLLQKFASEEPISSNDPLWNQLIALPFKLPLNKDQLKELDDSVGGLCHDLLQFQQRSGNFTSLVRVFLVRATELKTSAVCENELFLWQTRNALFILRCCIKYFIETCADESDVVHLFQPRHEPGQEHGNLLDAFLCALFEIIVDVPLTDTTYGLHWEVLDTLIICLSVQMYNELNSVIASPIHRHFLTGKCVIHAGLLVKTLTSYFINRPPCPVSISGESVGSGSLVLGLASGLWSALTLGYGSSTNSPSRPSATCPLDLASPLASRSLLLILVLSNQWTKLNNVTNPYRDALFSFDNSKQLSDGPSPSTHAVVTFRADFSALWDSLCTFLPRDDRVTLFLYLLLHRNPNVRTFILSRSDVEALVLPLLETLYESNSPAEDTKDGKQAPVPPSSHLIYMSLIVLLILSEDDLFNRSIHRIQISKVAWYKERSLPSISLGGLTILVLVRSIQANMTRTRDRYLHTNCLAALANMSNAFSALHPYVCQRLVSLFAVLARRYFRLSDSIRRHALQGEETLQDLSVLEEVLRMLLELLNSALDNQLPAIPDLLYSMLYKREVFEPFKTLAPFQDIACNIDLVLSFFAMKIESSTAGTDAGVSEVRQIIQQTSTHQWPKHLLKKFPELKFKYVEEENPEDFFVPYVWTQVFEASGIYWNAANITLFGQANSSVEVVEEAINSEEALGNQTNGCVGDGLIEFYELEFDDETVGVDDYIEIEISKGNDTNTTTVSFRLLKDLNDSFAETSNQQPYVLRVNCSLLSPEDPTPTQLSLVVFDANDNPPIWENEEVIQASIADNVPLGTDLSFFDDQLLKLIASDKDGGEENYKIMFECTSTNSVIQCPDFAKVDEKTYRPILVLEEELNQGVDLVMVTITAKNLYPIFPSGDPWPNATVSISIQNMPNRNPEFQDSFYTYTITEKSQPGKEIFTLKAEPDVAGTSIVYTLDSIDASVSDLLVTYTNGTVVLSEWEDLVGEYPKTFVYTATAVDSTSPNLFSSVPVIVNLEVTNNTEAFTSTIESTTATESSTPPTDTTTASPTQPTTLSSITTSTTTSDAPGTTVVTTPPPVTLMFFNVSFAICWEWRKGMPVAQLQTAELDVEYGGVINTTSVSDSFCFSADLDVLDNPDPLVFTLVLFQSSDEEDWEQRSRSLSLSIDLKDIDNQPLELKTESQVLGFPGADFPWRTDLPLVTVLAEDLDENQNDIQFSLDSEIEDKDSFYLDAIDWEQRSRSLSLSIDLKDIDNQPLELKTESQVLGFPGADFPWRTDLPLVTVRAEDLDEYQNDIQFSLDSEIEDKDSFYLDAIVDGNVSLAQASLHVLWPIPQQPNPYNVSVYPLTTKNIFTVVFSTEVNEVEKNLKSLLDKLEGTSDDYGQWRLFSWDLRKKADSLLMKESTRVSALAYLYAINSGTVLEYQDSIKSDLENVLQPDMDVSVSDFNQSFTITISRDEDDESNGPLIGVIVLACVLVPVMIWSVYVQIRLRSLTKEKSLQSSFQKPGEPSPWSTDFPSGYNNVPAFDNKAHDADISVTQGTSLSSTPSMPPRNRPPTPPPPPPPSPFR
ncbi:unnamed protein product [Cyprideis torosa]|uniref:Dymeclin n=1 Tax=Cyprideis torosa TaxID=163714 RepID=A0A7R8W4C7_9CRUS|nr:unnamed protein product [Cyprideis torosa]CAG0881772.1 unnamed protein product [Cyprideis torosa]